MTYLDNIKTNKVSEILEATEKNVVYFNSITDNTVKAYTKDIDSLMQKILDTVIKEENPDIENIEKCFVELTHLVYFMGERLESLGIYNDMSEQARKEVYNKAYLNNQSDIGITGKKPTVAENQAVAESESIYESCVNSIYERAYRIVKFKIEAAETMISTLSKMLSRRMNVDSNISNRKILNEVL